MYFTNVEGVNAEKYKIFKNIHQFKVNYEMDKKRKI